MTQQIMPLSRYSAARWDIPQGIGRPAALDDTFNGQGPSLASLDAPPSVNELIDEYEIDVCCTQCSTTVRRPIAWLRRRYVMSCTGCQAIVALNTSSMMEEIRSVGRLMRELQAQLVETVYRVNSILRR